MTTFLSRLRAEYRQRQHHRAFRIAPPSDTSLVDELTRLLTALRAQAPPAEPTTTEDTPPPPDHTALAEVATSLWRAQRRLAQDEDGSCRYTGPAARQLERCREWLDRMGLVVQEHDGDPYHPGLLLEVLAFEDTPELEDERVLHTVRPSVYFQGHHIQTAQVIVGCPVSEEDNTTGTDREGGTRA